MKKTMIKKTLKNLGAQSRQLQEEKNLALEIMEGFPGMPPEVKAVFQDTADARGEQKTGIDTAASLLELEAKRGTGEISESEFARERRSILSKVFSPSS